MKKRLHILFSFCLLISFSWQCAAKSIIYFSFKNNQKQLSETVCVNRNKPKNCCAAKCYLDKEMKKEDNRQSGSSSSTKDKAEKFELRTGFINFIFSTVIVKHEFTMFQLKKLPHCFLLSVFHPPII